MDTIFENIGFQIHGEADVYRLADFVLNSGQIFNVGEGAYAMWQDGSGAEIWVRIALDHEAKSSHLLNIDPHFHGDTVWRLHVQEELKERDDFLDGKFVLSSGDGKQFFPARIMGLQALREFHVGGDYHFMLAMIPHGVRLFPDEEAYRSYYKDERTVMGSFFPRGLYAKRLAAENGRREDVLLTRLVGRVLSGEPRQIQAAGNERLGWFWHLRVETLMGPIDMPVAARMENPLPIEEYLANGGAVISTFGTIGALVVVRKKPEDEQA